ncbi:MAG: hypothetical protein IT555_10990 [Acetobacteraceae bacterium]|nr:hypothetical protein [Acetobacteraceae bacterium]
MPRAVPAVVAFNAGELAPYLHARADLAKYPAGCRSLENMLVMAEGPVTRRPGLRFIAATKANGVARLIPFEFSTTQAYVIEAGDGYLRFYKDGGQIEASPGVPYEIAAPYVAADLALLRWVQSADTLYLAHPLYAPRKLTRSGHTAWTLTTIAFTDGPYLTEATDLTITPAATTGATTLTASAAVFAATDVGRLVRLKHGATWGWATITAFTSTTVVDATVGGDFGAAAASDAYRLGSWRAANYPGTVAFYEERLAWAGTPGEPQTIWASKTGDFENHTTGAASDDALQFTLVDGRMNAIRWLMSQRVLLAGTASGEFAISAASTSGALTPTDSKSRRQTTEGSAMVAPVAVSNAVLYVQQGGRALLEIAYRNEIDAYASPEISTLARHITRPGLVEMAWQQNPWRVLWCVRADGGLVAMTYMRDQEVVAWHRHPIGGTDAQALSIAVIPNSTSMELWVLVQRTINGATARYVERMDPEFYSFTSTADAFFVDSGLTYTGAPTLSITGLGHLVGETVQVLGDGAVQPPAVVDASGAIALQVAASKVQVGLGYACEVEPLDIQAGAMDGSNLTRTKRVHSVGVMLYQTLGCRVGYRDPETDELTLERIEFRRPSDPMTAPPAIFTGTHVVSFPARWSRDASVVVVQDQPLPLTVLGIVPRMSTNE